MFILLSWMLVGSSCKKSPGSIIPNPIIPTAVDPKAINIYTTGYFNGLGGYWKNTSFSVLNDSNNIAEVNDIKTLGNDVYTTGFKFVNTTEYAVYWKNQQAFLLTDGKNQAAGLSLALQGTDFYVCGYEGRFAKYWKNGIGHNLTDGSNTALASSIQVYGNDIYIAGTENGLGKFWINGNAYSIPSIAGQLRGTGMAVSSQGVYLVGSVTDKSITLPYNTGVWEPTVGTKAVYWLNGQIHYLDDGKYSAYATNIAISGSDIYIVGMDNSGSFARDVEGGTYFHSVIKLWKNGVPISITDGTEDATVSSVFVNGNDIYLAGDELSPNGRSAIYWKNGQPTVLASQGSSLTSIILGE